MGGMSFRLFIYYCALVGAWTGFVGWALGRSFAESLAAGDNLIWQDGFRGLFLGVLVAFGLSVVDALWNVGWRRLGSFVAHIGVAVIVGAAGGFAGGSLAQWLIGQFGNQLPTLIFFVMGWTIAGLLIGASIAMLDFLLGLFRNRDRRTATAKFLKCTVGGGFGGLIGALVSYVLREGWISLFSSKDPDLLWSPTALGFVMLGLFIGLLVGLAQVVLKEAWLKVEVGFRPGREMILTKDGTSIGRDESSDVGLFGDPAVEKAHAHIVLQGAHYHIEDLGSKAGTFVNESKISGRISLRSGDLIRIGKNVLRFGERKRR